MKWSLVAPVKEFVWLGCLEVGGQMMFIQRMGSAQKVGGQTPIPQQAIPALQMTEKLEDAEMYTKEK